MPKVVRAADLPNGHHKKPRPIPPLDPPVTLNKTSKQAPTRIQLGDRKYEVSPILHLFFKFACERHYIHLRRHAGWPQPWTLDSILQEWPFTNIFRVLDRNTQYVLRNVIGQGSQGLEESVFRVLLFRTFNKIETWELLKDQLGELTWEDFTIDKYEEALEEIATSDPNKKRRELYNNAYIIPAPRLDYETNYQAHLRLIEAMMTEDLPNELLRFKHLKDAHGYLSLWPSMGDFTAMQMLLDLNMLPHFRWSEDEWVALGPGSRACLEKMFGADMRDDRRAAHALRYLRDAQWSWWGWAGVSAHDVPRLAPGLPAGLSLVDIEHALCECEKYSRAGLPGAALPGGRTQVGKRRFRPRAADPGAELPAHWLTPRAEPVAPVVGQAATGAPDEYEVEAIVAERGNSYCVRWAGWSIDDDTWEPRDNLAGARELVDEWNDRKQRILDAVESRRAGAKVARKRAVSARIENARKRKRSLPSDVSEEDEDEGRRKTRSSRRTTIC